MTELSRTLADVLGQNKSLQEGQERQSPDTSKVFGDTNNLCDYDVACPGHTPIPVMDSCFPHRSSKLPSTSSPPVVYSGPLRSPDLANRDLEDKVQLEFQLTNKEYFSVTALNTSSGNTNLIIY